MTHILLINPNISDSVSDLIRDEAQRSAAPDTSVEVLTAPFGVAYTETRFGALIGANAAAQLEAELSLSAGHKGHPGAPVDPTDMPKL